VSLPGLLDRADKSGRSPDLRLIEIQLAPKVYKKGTLGPPDGNYLSQDLTWYETGVIEWVVN